MFRRRVAWSTFMLGFLCILVATASIRQTAHRSRRGSDQSAGEAPGIAAGIQPPEPITTELIASGFTSPVFATHAPGDFTRLFVLEKGGDIRIVNLKTGAVNALPFLTVSVINGSERGLLGLAFHPDYQTNGLFYIYFSTTGTTLGGISHIRQFTVSGDPDLADANSGVELLTFDQPETNHNAGWIGFGPNDGFLYIASGDGGGSDDEHGLIGSGQDLNTLLGKLLRIDVNDDDFPADADRNYAIPADNPFVGNAGALDEIWAYGLRNPWRCSFDRANGDLFIADVGQNIWEEIDYQAAASDGGENYGWRCFEATNDFNVQAHCSGIGHIAPIREYIHTAGRCSITGGYRYRGCAIPTWQGEYFFADWCTGEIFSFNGIAGTLGDYVDRTAELAPGIGMTINRINSFGEDARGEIYIVDWDGDIFRIAPVTATIDGADVDCSGSVDVNDLLAVLFAWGLCDGCASDINGDHQVSVNDLLILLARWD